MSRFNQYRQWDNPITPLAEDEKPLGHSQRGGINLSSVMQKRGVEKLWEDQPIDILKIRSGAIIPGGKLLGTEQWYFYVDANMNAGLRKLIGFPHYFGGDPQSDNHPATPRTRGFRCGGYERFQLLESAAIPSEELTPPTTETILTILRNSGKSSALRRAVLGAEIAEFAPEEVQEICKLLRQYISAHRSISDHDTEVAVASAVRTYIALLPADQLDEIAGLLETTTALPQSFESEVAKMVVRKLTAVPPDRDDLFPALADQVAGLASAYLHPRLLTRPYYGAIALNSVLALVLLRAKQWPKIDTRIHELNANWFRQQLGRRAGRIVGDLLGRFPNSQIQSQLSTLQALIDMSKV